jgi:type IV secretory pathway TrbD component
VDNSFVEGEYFRTVCEQRVCSWRDLSKCADREAAMFSGILEAVVANPPHIMNIIRGFIAFYGFTVTFNDDVAFT